MLKKADVPGNARLYPILSLALGEDGRVSIHLPRGRRNRELAPVCQFCGPIQHRET